MYIVEINVSATEGKPEVLGGFYHLVLDVAIFSRKKKDAYYRAESLMASLMPLPPQLPKESLRYLVGSIIACNGSPVSPEDETLFLSHGYRKAVFPAVDHAVAVAFPYTGSFSTVVGVWRVYPALREYIRELYINFQKST